MQRLFVAVDLPETIKMQLKALCVDLVGAKWVSHPQMHLTLRFIGEADAAQQANIQTGLATVRATPFKLGLQGIDQFLPKGKPRIIWVGVKAEAGLYELQKKIEHVIRNLRFEPDFYPFSPHITLARLKTPTATDDVQRYMTLHTSFKTDAFDVTEFILYSSQLASSGSIYGQEGQFPLV